ncbi:hypothetical protein DOTSEDRAFT_74140 [Dothistroma septosporum NZE10]|uniref:Uncharacterized protein n=1 Tax=Dothistroma septosporum (strain NZE10 / CBS 128990) TaxID=675120 RepID=N1PFV4_DOTSN|nr:hypothetical protein DOTSEDRAFT_74140 [Dothistroma septosporum NZE10]
MGLPAELRNRIYYYIFNKFVVKIPRRREPNPKGLLEAPGLLVTCKQAHAEAINIHYCTVAFQVYNCYCPDSVTRLPKFLKTLGQQKVDLLRRIRVRHISMSGCFNIQDLVHSEVEGAERALECAREEILKAPKKVTLKEGVLKACVSIHSAEHHFKAWTSEPSKVADKYLAKVAKEK